MNVVEALDQNCASCDPQLYFFDSGLDLQLEIINLSLFAGMLNEAKIQDFLQQKHKCWGCENFVYDRQNSEE